MRAAPVEHLRLIVQMPIRVPLGVGTINPVIEGLPLLSVVPRRSERELRLAAR